MNLLLVSLTGADDAVSPNELLQLSQKYPFVEWAILSSQAREGTSRYPTASWVENFHKVCPNVRKALHLCGKDVDAFLAEDQLIMEKVSMFDRVQLNFNQRVRPKNLETLAQIADSIPQSVILQHNSANQELWSILHNKMSNLSMLFDASGGHGVAPVAGWPSIFPNTDCGYAGGLGPQNVAQELQSIVACAGGNRFWIDMESKLRTPEDDRFSLAACESVLAQVAGHLA